jgi:hypothetical protein
MYINQIIEENLKGSEKEEIVTQPKELVEVKDAIERLNGETKTGVVLKKDDTNYMIVGGGKDNKYVVYAHVNARMYIMANKFDVPKPSLEMIVGGKKKIFPSKRCLNLKMVLEGAKHFADRGTLAQTFNWEIQ